MPTMREVAALAGVSVRTVSHVINDTRRISPATRARVEQAIARLDSGHGPFGPTRGARESNARGGASDPVGDLKIPELNSRQQRRGVGVAVAGNGAHAPSVSVSATDATDSAVPAKATRMLLRLLHAAQPISRVELARRLGVDRSTVTAAFKPLIAAGLVREDPLQQPSGVERGLGRPPTNLSFNTDHGFFIGVSIGVRRSQVGLTTLSGEIIAEENFDTPAEHPDALKLIREAAERLCDQISGRELKMIGVSVPGPTDARRSTLLFAPHLGWRDVPVAEALRLKPRRGGAGGAPVVVENDATAAAIYEARRALRGPGGAQLNDFVLVRSGTGIGVGLVLGGEVYRGTGKGEGIAGEFGHTTIVAGGKQCVCGSRGCWERYGSASAASSLYVGDRAQLGGMKPPGYVEIVARAEGGELRAQRTLERVGEYLGIGIGNVISGLGVPHVIVSGRIVYGWKFISGPLRDAVASSMAGQLTGWSVEPGAPKGAGLGGALEVAVDGFLASGLGV